MVSLGCMQFVAHWGMWHSSRPFFAFFGIYISNTPFKSATHETFKFLKSFIFVFKKKTLI